MPRDLSYSLHFLATQWSLECILLTTPLEFILFSFKFLCGHFVTSPPSDLWSSFSFSPETRVYFLDHSSQVLSLALWARSTKNSDCSTGPLAPPFAHSLAPLTSLLAPHYSLRSRASLRSLARSLAHFAHSLARGTVIFLCLKMTWFCPIVYCSDI